MSGEQLSQLRVTGRRAWRVLEAVAAVGALILSVLLASGWRVQQPREVLGSVESALDSLARRTATLETNHVALRAELQGIVRMQCLMISRRDANLAGTCTNLPTRDDSRAGRP